MAKAAVINTGIITTIIISAFIGLHFYTVLSGCNFPLRNFGQMEGIWIKKITLETALKNFRLLVYLYMYHTLGIIGSCCLPMGWGGRGGVEEINPQMVAPMTLTGHYFASEALGHPSDFHV